MSGVAWRAVAEPPDLAKVAGPRVRFLCIDANDAHVVLGANTGSAYVFARTRAPRDGGREAPDAGPSEGPMRFLTMVSPAGAPPIEPADGGDAPAPAVVRRNITPAIAKLRLNPDGTLPAVANTAGILQILDFDVGGDARRPGAAAAAGPPRPGRVVAQIPSAHAGRVVTCIEWSRDGRRVLSADDAGVVAVTDISGYGARDDGVPETFSATESASESSSREPPGVPSTLDRITEASSSSASDALKKSKSANPSVVRPMTVEELLTTAAITSVLDVGSRVVQGSFSPDGETALVSTTEAAVLLGVRSGLHPRVGSKPREGVYGGCFHRGAARAAVRLGLVDPAEAAGRSSDDDDGISGSTKSRGEGGGGDDAGARAAVDARRSPGAPAVGRGGARRLGRRSDQPRRLHAQARDDPPDRRPRVPRVRAYARRVVGGFRGAENSEAAALGVWGDSRAGRILRGERLGARDRRRGARGRVAPRVVPHGRRRASGRRGRERRRGVVRGSRGFEGGARARGTTGLRGPESPRRFFARPSGRGCGASRRRATRGRDVRGRRRGGDAGGGFAGGAARDDARGGGDEARRGGEADGGGGARARRGLVDAAAAADADADADAEPIPTSEEALGELRDALDAYEPVSRARWRRGGRRAPPRSGKRRDEAEGRSAGRGNGAATPAGLLLREGRLREPEREGPPTRRRRRARRRGARRRGARRRIPRRYLR